MPNYEDDIKDAGWVKDGKHWVHPDKPGVKYWSPVEAWQKETFPGKRPYSAVPPETPPAPSKAAPSPVATAAKAAPKPAAKEPPKPLHKAAAKSVHKKR